MPINHNAEWETLDAAPSNPGSGNHKLYFKDGDLHAVNNAGTERNLQKAHNWEYADATAREAATGFTSADLKKLALQLDDMSLWVLTNDSPVTWVRVGADTSRQSGVLYTGSGNYMEVIGSADTSVLSTASDIGTPGIPDTLAATLIIGDTFRLYQLGQVFTGATPGDYFDYKITIPNHNGTDIEIYFVPLTSVSGPPANWTFDMTLTVQDITEVEGVNYLDMYGQGVFTLVRIPDMGTPYAGSVWTSFNGAINFTISVEDGWDWDFLIRNNEAAASNYFLLQRTVWSIQRFIG